METYNMTDAEERDQARVAELSANAAAKAAGRDGWTSDQWADHADWVAEGVADGF